MLHMIMKSLFEHSHSLNAIRAGVDHVHQQNFEQGAIGKLIRSGQAAASVCQGVYIQRVSPSLTFFFMPAPASPFRHVVCGTPYALMAC
jgi:hypothetical protein